jgi:predicted nuclease with TOPRIM domain
MKVCVLYLCVLLVFGATAQTMDKQEAKIWKDKLKNMSVEEFKNLVESKNKTQINLQKAQKEAQENKNLVLSKDDELAELKRRIRQLEKETAEIDASDKSDRGIVFRIQIGAFEKIDLTAQANNQKTDLKAEKKNNVKQYTVGYFRDYWQADKFKKCLQSQGITDAWIVAYKDGVRVDIKDVLKEVI